MRELTGTENSALHHELETKAATLLGRILFGFSRLEMELGLCVAWVGRGARLEQLTREHEESGFSVRLNFLLKSVGDLLPEGSEAHLAYLSWIDQADTVRQVRNELIHGRWGVEPIEERVVNVIGLPTSQKQRSVSYSMDQLQEVLEELDSLLAGLRILRKKWPL